MKQLFIFISRFLWAYAVTVLGMSIYGIVRDRIRSSGGFRGKVYWPREKDGWL